MQRMQIASLLGEIQTLAYMVNTYTEFCCFTRFSGHVNRFEVELRESKERFQVHLTDDGIYLKPLDDSDDLEQVIRKLTKVKYELRKILRTHSVDYSRLNYSTEIVRHYHLS